MRKYIKKTNPQSLKSAVDEHFVEIAQLTIGFFVVSVNKKIHSRVFSCRVSLHEGTHSTDER